MSNDVKDDLEEAATAYEVFIMAGDRARLTPGEILELAAALNDLPQGKSFSVTVRTLTAEPAFSRRIAVEHD